MADLINMFIASLPAWVTVPLLRVRMIAVRAERAAASPSALLASITSRLMLAHRVGTCGRMSSEVYASQQATYR